MALPCPANPKETMPTPSYGVGFIVPVSASIWSTACSGLVIVGNDGPNTSASKMPTFAPIIARVYARFTEVVLFPTPPLQEETAMTCLTPRMPATVSGTSLVTGCAVMFTFTEVHHSMSPTKPFDSRSNSSFTGHAGVVSSSVNDTAPSARTVRSLTKPQFTTSSPKSGSITLRSAASTSASLEPSGADVIEGEEGEACARGVARTRGRSRPRAHLGAARSEAAPRPSAPPRVDLACAARRRVGGTPQRADDAIALVARARAGDLRGWRASSRTRVRRAWSCG